MFTTKYMINLYKEMEERQTLEAKIYKAIDSLEALIQHNFSEYLSVLREEIRKDTIEKISEK